MIVPAPYLHAVYQTEYTIPLGRVKGKQKVGLVQFAVAALCERRSSLN
jgi:hypothetical protein